MIVLIQLIFSLKLFFAFLQWHLDTWIYCFSWHVENLILYSELVTRLEKLISFHSQITMMILHWLIIIFILIIRKIIIFYDTIEIFDCNNVTHALNFSRYIPMLITVLTKLIKASNTFTLRKILQDSFKLLSIKLNMWWNKQLFPEHNIHNIFYIIFFLIYCDYCNYDLSLNIWFFFLLSFLHIHSYIYVLVDFKSDVSSLLQQ